MTRIGKCRKAFGKHFISHLRRRPLGSFAFRHFLRENRFPVVSSSLSSASIEEIPKRGSNSDKMREDEKTGAEDCELSHAPARPLTRSSSAPSLPLIAGAARTKVTVAVKTTATAMKATSSEMTATTAVAVGRIPSGGASSHWAWERKNLHENGKNMQ